MYPETDALLKELEEKIRKEYRKAESEMIAKLKPYYRRFELDDSLMQRQVLQGHVKPNAYFAWRQREMMHGREWDALRKKLATDLMNARQIAKQIALGGRGEAYAIGHAFQAFSIEKGLGLDLSFNLYSVEAVERLLKDNPQVLPPPGKRMKGRLERGEAIRWEEGQVQSVTLQGILQGESVPKLASRISKTLAVKDGDASVRYARSAINGAQNAGALDAMGYAQNLGVELEKEWSAAYDDRTRKAHRELDGVSVPLDEPFVNSIGEIMYPGSTDADGDNYWNCRCTLVVNLKGFPIDESVKYGKLKETEWEAWKNAHSINK